MLIDFHAHVYDDPGYGEALAEAGKNLGLDRLCIAGGEPRYGLAANAEVRRLAEVYPDLFVPFAQVHLGEETPVGVERLKRMGFEGLCVWAPPAPYDDEAFFGIYEAAQSLGMPILFHTCYMPRTAMDRAARVRSANMRPVYLDTVARYFPELKVVGVGLGSPWCEEAILTMQHNPNVCFDLSGDILRAKKPEQVAAMIRSEHGPLWESGAAADLTGQLVFGSAVRHEDIASVERDYQRLFRSLALGPEGVGAIMGGTAARLLGLSA